MFLPTKAHKQGISGSQKRLRIGNRAPAGAVNLAYSHAPALTPSQNIQITDTSGFVLENIKAAMTSDISMYPDETHLLQDADGRVAIDAETFLLTNVFNGNNALFFAHRLRYPIYDKVGPDAFGFYQGKTISLVDRDERPVDPSTYRIQLAQTSEPDVHTVFIFTSFQTTATYQVRAIYTAYKGNGLRTQPGTQEQINPQSIFRQVSSIANVLDPIAERNPIYYRTNGAEYGTSKVYVPARVISDNRTPVFTRYRVYAKDSNGDIVVSTPWLPLYVHNRTSATPDELGGFLNTNMVLEGGEDAAGVIKRYTGLNRNDTWTYYVESTNGQVTASTATDGFGELFAYTTADTGNVLVPDQYEVQTRGITQTFDMSIWLVPPSGSDVKALSLEGYNLSADEGLSTMKLLDPNEWTLPAGFDPATWSVRVTLDTAGIEGVIALYNADVQTYLSDEQGFPVVPYQEVVQYPIYIVGQMVAIKRTFRPAYKIRLTGARQIKPLMPRETNSIESWYIRVQNGKFQVKTYDDTGNPISYAYMVPEYFRQPFDSTYGTPYMLVVGETPKVTGERRVKVRFTPLFIDYDPNSGTIQNVSIEVNGFAANITSWDTADGSFDLDVSVRESDQIKVSYFYEENSFTYRGYYDETMKKFIALDLNPGYGHIYTKPIIESGRTKVYAEVKDVPTFGLINETIYLYLKPVAILNSNGRVMPGTFNTAPLYHSFAPSDDPLDILLAKIQVRPNSAQDSIQMIDTRTRGGGLLEEIGQSIIEQICPEAKFYWDIGFWDGQPYQENAVVVVRLPRYLLKEAGGRFSREEINEVVEKHIAFGTFYIMDYIDESPLTIQTPENLTVEQIDQTITDQTIVDKPTFTLTITNVPPWR